MRGLFAMIRQLSPEDASLLRSLRLRALSDAPFAFRGTLAEESQLSTSVWQDMLRDGNNRFFILETNDVVCGIGGVFAPDDELRAQLWFLWVPSTHRGRGSSDELVEHVIKWARDSRATRLSLHVSDGNVPAENLYLRHGFRRTGVTLERERDGAIEFEMELGLN